VPGREGESAQPWASKAQEQNLQAKHHRAPEEQRDPQGFA